MRPWQHAVASGNSASSELPLEATSSLLHEELQTAPPAQPRVLITGATGLLGRQVIKAMDRSWEVRGLGFTRASPPLISCDLTEIGVAAQQVEDFQPHIVIHLAVERREDVVNQNPQKAELLNVVAASEIASVCERLGSWLICVSTNAVFEGAESPYTTETTPKPLSEYSKQKVRSEVSTTAVCMSAALLRVPVMYGPVNNLQESAITGLLEDLRNGETQVDDFQLLHPTWAGDVAGVIRTMVDLHFAGNLLQGFFHWQGREAFTKYQMAQMVAEVTGFDASELHPTNDMVLPDSPRKAAASVLQGVMQNPDFPMDRFQHRAPHWKNAWRKNLALDCSRLEDMIGSDIFRTPFRVGLKISLAPWQGSQVPVPNLTRSSSPTRKYNAGAADKTPFRTP